METETYSAQGCLCWLYAPKVQKGIHWCAFLQFYIQKKLCYWALQIFDECLICFLHSVVRLSEICFLWAQGGIHYSFNLLPKNTYHHTIHPFASILYYICHCSRTSFLILLIILLLTLYPLSTLPSSSKLTLLTSLIFLLIHHHLKWFAVVETKGDCLLWFLINSSICEN